MSNPLLLKSLGLSLSPLKVRSVLKSVGKDKAGSSPDTDLSLGEALILWLADWLAKRKPIDDDQQQLVIDEFAADIVAYAVKPSGAQIEASLLVIVDNTFAGISGRSGYLDLRSGELVEGLTQMPMEVYSINLAALLTLHTAILTEKS